MNSFGDNNDTTNKKGQNAHDSLHSSEMNEDCSEPDDPFDAPLPPDRLQAASKRLQRWATELEAPEESPGGCIFESLFGRERRSPDSEMRNLIQFIRSKKDQGVFSVQEVDGLLAISEKTPIEMATELMRRKIVSLRPELVDQMRDLYSGRER